MKYWHYKAWTGESMQDYRYSIVETPDSSIIYWETEVGSLDAPNYIAAGSVWKFNKGSVLRLIYRDSF